MNAPICSVHNVAMTLRPAGVSKTTGKGYPAFWACPDRTGGVFCKKTVQVDEWTTQQNENPVEKFERSLNEEPIKSAEVEEPMKRKDWNFKAFTEGLRALTFEARKDDMHPTNVWDKTHTREWMRALYGDEEGYNEWERKLEVRLSRMSQNWTKADETAIEEELGNG